MASDRILPCVNQTICLFSEQKFGKFQNAVTEDEMLVIAFANN